MLPSNGNKGDSWNEYFDDCWRQMKALTWKNFMIKFSNGNWKVLLLEILVPTLIIYSLVLIKGSLKPTLNEGVMPEMHYYAGVVPTITEMYDQAQCGSSNLVWRCTNGLRDDGCSGSNGGQRASGISSAPVWNASMAANSEFCSQHLIAVAPLVAESAAAATAANFVSWANTETAFGTANVIAKPTFQLFDSEQAFLDLIDTQLYSFSGDVYSSAVIMNTGFPDWDYTIRLNKTYSVNGRRMRDVQTVWNDVDNSVKSSEQGSSYYASWIYDGYVTLSNTVNTYVATQTCISAGTCTSGETYDYKLEQSNPFPSPAYNTTGFWGALGFIFALFMIITLLYPLANAISVLVREKEAKLREGMKMMSLKSEILWFSWWFNFMALFLPLSLILTWVGSSLFTFSANVLIFSYFFVFFLSATSYAIFMSAFFTNSRTASIVGCLVFLCGFFLYVGMQSNNPSRNTILIASLHPATAFTFSTLAFAEYEDREIGVTFFTWDDSNNYDITFKDCLVMMIIDAVWLSCATWYIDKVWPSEFGTQEPWYFIFQPSYYKKAFGYNIALNSVSADFDGVDVPAVNVESVSKHLQDQLLENTCVDIRNLRKEFPMSGGTKTAVDGLNLTMFNGQITALLGHNGAGKTTAIAMLTGLIPSDGGTAIIEGMDINEDMNKIRKNLGVCPQHDILFPDLTVRQHLSMFAVFKGCQKENLEAEVDAMIDSVGLTEKSDVYSRWLSGGQKRKLCVGIAFIGGSRVVFLDEPTAGMDPYSRRFTWNLIREHREGRVIVLTTHFMDEADLLGDRIAIMGDGKLLCCGSSLYLKNLYGVGYNMIIEKRSSSAFNSTDMMKLVKKYVPHSLLLTDVGTEMSVQLPFSSSAAFPGLFENIDKSSDALGVDSYGISVTTLEEVFIKVTKSLQHSKAILSNDKSSKDSYELVATGGNTDTGDEEQGQERFESPIFEKIPEDNHFEYFIEHVVALIIKRALYFIRDLKAQVFTFVVPIFFLLTGLTIMSVTYPGTFQPLKQISASLYNTKVTTNVMPTPYMNPSEYTYQVYVSKGKIFPGATYSRDSTAIAATQSVLDSMPSNYPLLDAINGDGGAYAACTLNTTSYLIAHKNDNEAMIVGTYAMTNTVAKNVQFVVSTNYTAVFGVPVYQQMMADATIKSLEPTASVKTSMYPFPETRRQDDAYSNYNVDLVVTFILLAIPFVPAAFITYIVREKEVKSKQQQMISGVGIVAYWMATFLWDNLSFFATTCIFAFLVCGPIFPGDTSALGGEGSVNSEALGCFFGLFMLFGMSMAGFTYLFSFLFEKPSNAQVVMIFVCFISGLVLSIVGIIMRILPDYNIVFNQTLRYVFCLFPPYAFGEGLHNMALLSVWSGLENGGVLYNVRDWKITGIPMMMMAWESVVFLGATILFEYFSAIPSLQQYFAGHLPPTDQYDALKDASVKAEEDLVNSGKMDFSSTICLKNVMKLYSAGMCKPESDGVFAVKGVSLSIPNGQCFGLLGINGAGKSSLLSMLSGEFAPSSGQLCISGLDLLTQIHTCRRKIGFCPQFDSLFELLTGREHLELYSRIKGIKKEFIKSVVDAKIKEMSLTEYADRKAGTYSGGNKRKLSVAIAMIGEPSIVFLDEPSTGMDPVARRFMWDLISDIVTKREKCALILTTHSMEECEALCTRIGIMVGGILRCLGSAQKLRNTYGNGFQIEIGMDLAAADVLQFQFENIMTFLKEKFGSFSVRERHDTKIRIEVESNKEDGTPRKLSEMFSDIENYRKELHIQDYSIAQTSLEQIFNHFAAQQEGLSNPESIKAANAEVVRKRHEGNTVSKSEVQLDSVVDGIFMEKTEEDPIAAL